MNRLVLLAAMGLAGSALGAPGAREGAALAAIDLGPKVPAYVRGAAITQIEGGLAAAGYRVVPSNDVAQKLTGLLAACREGPCLGDVAAALGVSSIVTASITSNDESTIVVLRLFGGDAGLVAEVREVCDLCGQSELSERVSIAASALRARAEEARRKHEAMQVAPGPPAPVAPAPATATTSSSMFGIAIAVGAAGAVAIGAGAYLIAIDGHGTCSPGDGPVYPDPGAVIRYPDPSNPTSYVCRDVYRTKVGGIVATGVGALALIGGTYFAIRAHGHHREIEVAPTRGGAMIGATWTW